jgi:predicted DNA-binding transcriptional regulator AlpA
MRLLRFEDLALKGISYGRDHLRYKCKAGEFPSPVQISPKRIAWREDDVDQWIASLVRQGEQAKPRGRVVLSARR